MEGKTTGPFIAFIGLAYHEDWLEGEYKTEVSWWPGRSSWAWGLGHGGRAGAPAVRARGA